MGATIQMAYRHAAPPQGKRPVPYVTRILRLPEKPMFRTLVLAAAFFGITLALFMLQPAADQRYTGFDDTVTRAAAAAVPAIEIAPVISPLATGPAPNIPVTTAAMTDAAPAWTETVARPTGDAELRAMTQGVLAGLGITPASLSPARDDQDDALRAMSLTALSGLRNVTAQVQPVETPLQTLIVQALQAGQSDTYIDALLNEAAGRGEITVPRALMTADGRVDTHVILGSIVAQASKESGVPQAARAAPGGAGVEVRTVQRAGESVQYNFYTVSPGDSLGAIAVKFYGDAAHYSSIFNANRALLSSPDKLRIGQRLVIPNI